MGCVGGAVNVNLNFKLRRVEMWEMWFAGEDENLEVELFEIWPEGAKLGNVRWRSWLQLWYSHQVNVSWWWRVGMYSHQTEINHLYKDENFWGQVIVQLITRQGWWSYYYDYEFWPQPHDDYNSRRWRVSGDPRQHDGTHQVDLIKKDHQVIIIIMNIIIIAYR